MDIIFNSYSHPPEKLTEKVCKFKDFFSFFFFLNEQSDTRIKLVWAIFYVLSWSFCSPPYFDISNPLKIPTESISNTNITQSWLSQETFIFDYLCPLLYRHHLVSWMLLFSLYPGHFTPSSFPSIHHVFSFPLNTQMNNLICLLGSITPLEQLFLNSLSFLFMLLIPKDFYLFIIHDFWIAFNTLGHFLLETVP